MLKKKSFNCESPVTDRCITPAAVLVHTGVLSIKRSESESRIVVFFLLISKVGVVVYGISRMTSPLTHNNSRSRRTSLPAFIVSLFFFSGCIPVQLPRTVLSAGSSHGCFHTHCKYCTDAFIETFVSVYLILSEFIVVLYTVDLALCLE